MSVHGVPLPLRHHFYLVGEANPRDVRQTGRVCGARCELRSSVDPPMSFEGRLVSNS